MIIKTPPGLIFKQRGRPNKYPFNQLKPGQSLIISIVDELDIGRIKSAFYQYRKLNKLKWVCSVRVINDEIFVNRIK